MYLAKFVLYVNFKMNFNKEEGGPSQKKKITNSIYD